MTVAVQRIIGIGLLAVAEALSAATLESIDEEEQIVTFHLTREEQKGCCSSDSRLEVHKNGTSIGDFKVVSYSSKTARVRLNVEDNLSQFTKDAAWTVYLYMGDAEDQKDMDTSDVTYLSVEDRMITYEKLKDNHAGLLKKLRGSKKKLSATERRKLAREVRTAEKLAREYKDKFFDSTVYRSDKVLSLASGILVVGYPFAGAGAAAEVAYFLSGQHQIGLMATSVSGELATEVDLDVKVEHLALYYRGYLANSFNMSAGAYFGRYSFAPAVTVEETEGHSGAGLRIGFGNRWQWRLFHVGWDYLDVRIPFYGTKAEDKERTMLLTTMIVSSFLSVGLSF